MNTTIAAVFYVFSIFLFVAQLFVGLRCEAERLLCLRCGTCARIAAASAARRRRSAAHFVTLGRLAAANLRVERRQQVFELVKLQTNERLFYVYSQRQNFALTLLEISASAF